LAVRFANEPANFTPVRLGVDVQRHPSLTSRIGRWEESIVLKKLILSIKTEFQPEGQTLLVFSKAREHLLAGTKSRMTPGEHLTSLRQGEAKRTNSFQGFFVSFGTHRGVIPTWNCLVN